MKLLRLTARHGILVFTLLAGLLLSGCLTEKPHFIDPADLEMNPISGGDRGEFRVGDMVTVSYSGNPMAQTAAYVERIKEDGFITLPLVGSIKAAGKTAGQLQKEIYNLYVPKIYPYV